MAIHFAAVHERNSWRKHSIHKTLDAAISGPDGAERLLRKAGRVAKMQDTYGAVHAVFVWDDTMQQAKGFRLARGSTQEIEHAEVLVELLERFDKGSGPSSAQIERWFSAVATSGMWHPDDLPEGVTYLEGTATQVLVNAYERNTVARQTCIDHHGPICKVCDLDFEDRYGSLGKGFIHVHHEVPIASIGQNYRVDPVLDLKPLCPNCHAMVHRTEPPLPIARLREILRKRA